MNPTPIYYLNTVVDYPKYKGQNKTFKELCELDIEYIKFLYRDGRFLFGNLGTREFFEEKAGVLTGFKKSKRA